MSWRGTLILALLLAGVGLFYWVDEPPTAAPGKQSTLLGEPREPLTTPGTSRLIDFDPNDVVKVQLAFRGEQRGAVRNGDHWDGAANPTLITDFLRDVASLGTLADIPAESGDLKEFGLQPPRGVLLLRLRDHSEPEILQIGDPNPATTGVYVRLGTAGKVALAGALVGWKFEKTFEGLSPVRPEE